MQTLHAKDMYVVVGDAYAKRLGYEELVGAMGIINDVMNALCGVTILSGNPDMIGKQVDIHLEDCILQEYGERNQYGVVINLDNGHIYYSSNIELVESTTKRIQRYHETREFRNIAHMHEVLDFCVKDLPRTAAKMGYEWICFCLDDEACEATKEYREAFEADKEYIRRMQKAFIKPEVKQQKPNSTLVDELRAQMDEQISQAMISKKKSEEPPSIQPDKFYIGFDIVHPEDLDDDYHADTLDDDTSFDFDDDDWEPYGQGR